MMISLDLFFFCDFYGLYHGNHNKPQFGRIFLELFSSIEQADPSNVNKHEA